MKTLESNKSHIHLNTFLLHWDTCRRNKTHVPSSRQQCTHRTRPLTTHRTRRLDQIGSSRLHVRAFTWPVALWHVAVETSATTYCHVVGPLVLRKLSPAPGVQVHIIHLVIFVHNLGIFKTFVYISFTIIQNV